MKTHVSSMIKIAVAFAGFWCLSMVAMDLSAQTATTVTVQYGRSDGGTGSFSCTLPNGVTNVNGVLWGAGGGGGGARTCGANTILSNDTDCMAAGSGGGGGEKNTFNPGTISGTFSIVVGKGGNPTGIDIECNNGGDGGHGTSGSTGDIIWYENCKTADAGGYSQVTFPSSSYVKANGGGGGKSAAADVNYNSRNLWVESQYNAPGGTGNGGSAGGAGNAGWCSFTTSGGGVNLGSGGIYGSHGGDGGKAGGTDGGTGGVAPSINRTSHTSKPGGNGTFPGGGGAGGGALIDNWDSDGCESGDGGYGANGKVILTFSYQVNIPSISGNAVRYLPYGQAFTFEVASPSSLESYQWYKNGSPYATGSSCVVSTDGVYTVKAKNVISETVVFTGASSVTVTTNNDASSVSGTTLTVGSINEYGPASNAITVITLPQATGICVWSPDYPDVGGKSDEQLTNWNDPDNWVKGAVPGATEWAYIPSYNLNTGAAIMHFPFLKNTDNAACERIYLMQGAEIGNPQFLHYDGAYFQYNLGLGGSSQSKFTTKAELDNLVDNTNPYDAYDHLKFSAGLSQNHQLSRGKWHLLTAPMRGMVSGDYAFGGVPRTFIRKFDANLSNTGSTFKGNWTDYYTGNVELLAPAEGFALWINDYKDQMFYRETETGLNETAAGFTGRTVGLSQINGIFEFPYHNSSFVLEFSKHQLAHRAHKADAGSNQSTFYAYHVEDLRLVDKTEVINRGNAEYFNFDAANGQANGTGIVIRSITRGSQSDIALIGNPFPTTIHFDQLMIDNPGTIKNGYTLWTGAAFDSYSTAVGSSTTTGLTKYIAPGQGFLVELANGVNSATLSFNPATLSVRRTASITSTLRSEVAQKGIISIEAGNSDGGGQTFIGQSQTGQTTVSDWDMTKIITSFRSVPEVYTVKNRPDGTNLGVATNFIPGDAEMLIPIGIATTATGNLHFSLSGMDGFNAYLTFIDTQTNYENEITGWSEFNYDCAYTPSKNAANETLACENRFFVRVSSKNTALLPIDKPDLAVNVSADDSGIRFYSNYPMQSIYLYDLQGRLIAEKLNINRTVDLMQGIKYQSYIAKIMTEQGIIHTKVWKR
ncbi:hypothetical protein FACS189463_2530 [Bacteroidia bacterium]|nr:hypothetical protein FACS189463_2530 [Bacteroidia bacterium]